MAESHELGIQRKYRQQMLGLTPDGKIDEFGAYYSNGQRRHTPTSALMMHSERQFLDDYARGDKRNTSYQSDNTIWDKLSRIFTFGCIETSHNKR